MENKCLDRKLSYLSMRSSLNWWPCGRVHSSMPQLIPKPRSPSQHPLVLAPPPIVSSRSTRVKWFASILGPVSWSIILIPCSAVVSSGLFSNVGRSRVWKFSKSKADCGSGSGTESKRRESSAAESYSRGFKVDDEHEVASAELLSWRMCPW